MKAKTLIIRHAKENKKKCTLQPLKGKENFDFYSYPLKKSLPALGNYVLLTLDAEQPLSIEDAGRDLILIDATWRYAERMMQEVFEGVNIERRSLPGHYKTAYPRRQEDCPDESRGLASIEALYLAYQILGQSDESLLDSYYFKEAFKTLNHL